MITYGYRAEGRSREIKARLAEFLRETLGLELNQDKTLITHARTQRAGLGYDISVWHCNTKITSGRRAANGKIALRVPRVIGPSAPATETRQKRGTGPGSRTWTTTRSSGLTEPSTAALSIHPLAHSPPAVDALTSCRKPGPPSTTPPTWRPRTGEDPASDGLRTCFEARRHGEGKPDLGNAFRRDPPAAEPKVVQFRRPDSLSPQAESNGSAKRGRATTVAVHQVPDRPQRAREAGDLGRRGPRRRRACGARRSSSAPDATSTEARSHSRPKSLESSSVAETR